MVPKIKHAKERNMKRIIISLTLLLVALLTVASVAAQDDYANPELDLADDCSDVMPPQFSPVEVGRVSWLNGQPKDVHSAPAGLVIASLPEGTDFFVINGPLCHSGYWWWQIERNQLDMTTLVGWMKEAGPSVYYIEPWGGSHGGGGIGSLDHPDDKAANPTRDGQPRRGE
jgi:hypothetical protein